MIPHMVKVKLEHPSSMSFTSHFLSGLPLFEVICLGLYTYTVNEKNQSNPTK